MDPLDFYGILMALLLLLNITVTYLLTKGVIDSNRAIPALNERAFTSITKTVAVALLVVITANRVFTWGWPPEATVGLLVISTVITSASPIGWLWLYVTHKFGKGGEISTNANDVVLFKDDQGYGSRRDS